MTAEEIASLQVSTSPSLRDSFVQYVRNGRWGTCGHCPSDEHGAYPEKCRNTAWPDHNRTLEALVARHERYMAYVESGVIDPA